MAMRGLAAWVLAGWALPLAAGESVRVGVVVFDTGGRVSSAAQAVMREEAARILILDGVRLEWRCKDGLGRGVELDKVVVVRFARGGVAGIALKSEGGPLGSTDVSDGRVLPFVHIDAERVRGAVFRSRLGRRTDEQLGRALGRVLAHELYHALSGSQEHDHEGVAKAALSVDELTGGPLHLGAAARTRLMEALRRAE